MDIRHGFLFPWTFRFIGLLLMLTGAGLFTKMLWLTPILLLVGAFFITAYEGFEIDKATKKYREYTAYLFIKTGKFEPYSEIERIYINKGKESQRIYTMHTNQSAEFANELYKGYLKFSNGEKVLLQTTKKKDVMVKKLTALAQYVNAELVDNTV
ncbi:MAG: hypothetical protein HC811_06550 [Flammeovirgaceae bacterium]|nr:hypothetical protein [Flammeovirgaceae bacterium]